MAADSPRTSDGKPLPELPVPARARWQPLRIGLIELFHYDCEEFWFRDGHLLLRGNNGTGKSKVLSLTLPFLLDASLSSARVEPDGDRGKRMEWNLLLGRHERRLGYSWIEFGRIDETGAARYTTLGCGMQAVAGRSRVDSWYFITGQRVGKELSLISDKRHALSRESLNEALGDAGRLFDTAREYRRAVDERLFLLGERYDALIETLIQLRQPQLSRKPDEHSLSEALTNALPELPRVMMEDVAEAMNQLGVYRDELTEIEAVLAAVSQFDRRYRLYAQIQARRQARVLRRAQTEFDNQSRERSEAEAELTRARAAVAEHDARSRALDRELHRDRERQAELQADPTMADARRLGELEQNEQGGQRELAAAEKREAGAARQLKQERDELDERAAALEGARADVARGVDALRAPAREAGLEAGLAQLTGSIADEQLDTKALAALTASLREASRRRRAELAQLRSRLSDCDKAERKREAAAARSQDRRETLERTETQARAAQIALDAAAADLIAAYRGHLRSLRVLEIDDPEDALAELELWVETLAGAQPLSSRIDRARSAAEQRLAAERSELDRARQELAARQTALRDEQAELRGGNQRAPAPLPARAGADRNGRAGAPFFQLLEFRDHVAAETRAGLEAALEGAGLLDAWVTPGGQVLDEATCDAFLQVGPKRDRSLLDFVAAAEHMAVDRAVVEAILAAIDCGERDDTSADSWLSPGGEFRLGRLRGRFDKPEAEYVGWAAREAARLRRLAEIEVELETLATQLDALRARQADLDARRQLLTEELRNAPSDDALRSAHARFSAAEAQRREAQARLAEADVEREACERRLREARAELEADARDLRLPTAPEALAAVERALSQYEAGEQSLGHALGLRIRCHDEWGRQRVRAEQAQDALNGRRAELEQKQIALEAIRARLSLLRETAGAAVTELLQRLAAVKVAVEQNEAALAHEHKLLSQAHARLGGAGQRVQDAQALLDSRSAERKTAADRLQGFHATGLLALALPELELPERSVWSVDATLNLARRVEERLVKVAAEDQDWARVQSAISSDYTALGQALSALGQRAQMEQSDFGLIVQIIHRNRPERPDVLERLLGEEIEQRRGILSAREREILENHLQAEVAAHLQRLLREAQARVERINAELERRPTSTGVYFKLDWEPLPEGGDGAPAGLQAARTRLLRRTADAWSVDDRRAVGTFLEARIAAERAADDTSPMVELLTRALDYRRWHRFRVKRWHDGAFRPLMGPASSGERALGLTVPLFAAASSHYETAESRLAPRLVLLDEAFAGIDDEARAHCMALIREFDLDFVMTSEREWGCYATLPGVSICQLVRREGIDAVFVSRWSWDGRARRAEADPTRRFSSTESEAGTAPEARADAD